MFASVLTLAIGAALWWQAYRIARAVRKVATNDLRHVDTKLGEIHKDVRVLHADVQAVSDLFKAHLADHKVGRAHRRRGE